MKVRKTKIVSAALVLGGLVLALDAAAAPRGGRAGGADGDGRAAAHRPVLRGRFAGRMAERVQKPGKAAKTRGEIVAMFDANTTTKLHNGKTVSVQQLLDSLEDAEAEEQKSGSSLQKLRKDSWMIADTPAVISTQKVEAAQDLQKLLSAKNGLQPGAKLLPGAPRGSGAAPASQQNQVSWTKKLGQTGTVAAYTDFRASEQVPNATTASCNLTWDNGVYLLGEQKSLVKFLVETKTTTGSAPSASAKGSLYVLGSASPTWQKSGKFEESLDRTFSVKKGMDYTIIPGIYLKGAVGASTTLGLKPGVDSKATATQASCGINATPSLRADVAPEVSLHVGIPKVADIIEGGLKAEIALLDAKIPTSVNVALGGTKFDKSPVSVSFQSNLDVTFLRGKLMGWYKIDDICAWGYCLIEDGLGIDTSGEVKLWQGEGYPFKASLIDIRPTTNLAAQVPSGSLMVK